MMMTQLGEYLTTSLTTPLTMPALIATRSSRVMPGLRATPAVMITMSELAVSAISVVPTASIAWPAMGPAWIRSSTLPLASPSTTSTRTI